VTSAADCGVTHATMTSHHTSLYPSARVLILMSGSLKTGSCQLCTIIWRAA